MSDFVESEHPRDSDGKFTDKSGGNSAKQRIADSLDKYDHAKRGETLKSALDKYDRAKQAEQSAKQPEQAAKPKSQAERKKDVKKYLETFKDKPVGTYSYVTGEMVNLNDGYMFSFHCNEADEQGHYKSHYGRYTDAEYDELTNKFAQDYDAETFVGVYDDEPEVSFKIMSFDMAIQLMIEYEQDSIWDNAAGCAIKNTKRDKTKNPLRGE